MDKQRVSFISSPSTAVLCMLRYIRWQISYFWDSMKETPCINEVYNKCKIISFKKLYKHENSGLF